MKKRLWDSFITMVKESDSNGIQYYQNLKSWFNEHKNYLSEEHLKTNRLSILLSLDPLEYSIQEEGYSILNWEGIEGLGSEKMKLGTFIMLVSDEMWDMVTTIRAKQCPRCDEDEMRYIFIKTEKLEKEMLILECYRCGYCEDLNDKTIEDSIQIVRPAKKTEILINEG